MADPEVKQRLAAILAADVAGYSRLMGDDERATITTINRCRAVFREEIVTNGGRVVDMAGDSVLAVFDTAIGAATAAISAQAGVAELNADLPESRRMLYRIGINLGDIHEQDDGTIYGDGVNVAARVESLAEPGGISVSGKVHEEIEDRLDVTFADAGRHKVKNIARPVPVWRLLKGGETAPKSRATLLSPRALVAVGVTVVALAGIAIWQLTATPEPEQITEAPEDPILAMPTGPTIAVLPFDNLGDDADQDVFARGLTEDIITALSRFGEMRVIARNSTLQYQGQATDVREIGAALGADYVLEGSVRRAGDALRVAAQLLDARDGTHVWSEQFDRDLSAGAVFDIQDTITVAVATAIAGYNGAIARQILGEASGVRTEDLAAYECVLLVYVKYDSVLSVENFTQARDCLEAAIERDPNYVDALAALSYVYGDAYSMGLARDLEDFDPIERSFALASRAVELNPNSTAAHRSLALAHFYRHELVDFVEHADRALHLNPHDPQTLGQLGSYLIMMGESERGAALVHKAYTLNPALPDWYNITLAMERYLAHDINAALSHASKVKDPGNYVASVQRIVFLAELDRLDEAGLDFERLENLYPGYSIATLRDEGVYWNNTAEFLDRFAAGMRKAGFSETPPEPSRPVIAVLPFDNLSGDPEQDYFADGITEDIITRLAQFPELLVLARNTTFQFKGQAVDVAEIADKLGASYVVEGSIRRGGDTIRVSAQLIDADGTHLWAQSYDRPLDVANIFAVQDEVTAAIASRIGDPTGVIQRQEMMAARATAPQHLSSYECVLRAHDYVIILDPEAHRVARDCLEDVVEAEPSYGEAWAFLGDMYIDEIVLGFNPTAGSSLDRARVALERGVRLAPESAVARSRMARVLSLTGDAKRAREEADKAIALSPNNAMILGIAGEIYMNTGWEADAVALFKKIERLNPNFPPWFHWIPAKHSFVTGDYAAAIESWERTDQSWWYWPHAFIAASHCNMGNLDQGAVAVAKMLELNPSMAEVFWPEMNLWLEGADEQINRLVAGLTACGWDVPPGELIDE